MKQSMACLVTLTLVLGASETPSRAEAEQTFGRGDVGDPGLRRAAVVSPGDTARLQHALARARRGEAVTVGVIGGSITAGASASAEQRRWASIVARWWRDTFPGAEVTFVNAGIGATGSDIGAHRVRPHLLAHNPDFVVAEYAVNDSIVPNAAETFEGLVRQILLHGSRPALALLFTFNEHGANVQDVHVPIGAHYGLPMASARDALWPEIEAGRIAWSDIGADKVHPNDLGHAYYADFIVGILEAALVGLPDDGALPDPSPVPAPLNTDVFENTRMYCRETVIPKANGGWIGTEPRYRLGPGWTSDAPGATIAFDVEGTAFSIVYYRSNGPMGRASVQVDGGPAVTLDGYFAQDWGGGYTACQLVRDGVDPGAHEVRITVLDEADHVSDGHSFEVVNVLAAGPVR